MKQQEWNWDEELIKLYRGVYSLKLTNSVNILRKWMNKVGFIPVEDICKILK
jgi:hypothetical protein